jgi:hypothetical protein
LWFVDLFYLLKYIVEDLSCHIPVGFDCCFSGWFWLLIVVGFDWFVCLFGWLVGLLLLVGCWLLVVLVDYLVVGLCDYLLHFLPACVLTLHSSVLDVVFACLHVCLHAFMLAFTLVCLPNSICM